MILVITGSLHLYVLAVEKEPLRRIDFERAYAERCLITIDHLAAGSDFSDQSVEVFSSSDQSSGRSTVIFCS